MTKQIYPRIEISYAQLPQEVDSLRALQDFVDNNTLKSLETFFLGNVVDLPLILRNGVMVAETRIDGQKHWAVLYVNPESREFEWVTAKNYFSRKSQAFTAARQLSLDIAGRVFS